MANSNESKNFVFLLDAKTTRQYALELNKEERPVLPLYSYGGEKLKVGETVYAFDDVIERNLTGTNNVVSGGTVSATAFSFKKLSEDSQGEHFDIFTIPVTYAVKPYQDATGQHLALELTKESKDAIAAAAEEAALESGGTVSKNSFWKDFPTRFDKAETRTTAGVTTVLFPLSNTAGKASVARADIARRFPQAAARFNTVTQPKKTYKITDQALEAALAKWCLDLTAEARAGRLDPVIGRDEETDQALKVLTRRKQGSLCFTGDAGVGKTAMFSAVAERLIADEGNLPGSLQGARVLQLDLQSMTAGTRYRGDFEERIKPIIEGLAEREGVINGKKVILAIDEIHAQLKSGASDGSTDAGNMMKPMLTAKGVSVMGTTTNDEYRKYIEADSALASRFERMEVGSTNEEATIKILKNLWPLTRDHNHLLDDMSDETLSYIVTMTNRYAPQESQPRKAEKVMNMAAASAEFDHRTAINRDDIISAVSQMSHLSTDFLAQNDADRFLKMEEELPKEVLGQPCVKDVVNGLIGARGGLNDPNQPWGCFVFQGPTGTGKTELCKALARYLFGTEDAMLKFDMGSFQEKHEVSKLLGAPPGFVGYDDAPALTESVRKQPYSIILFDEIEKAHPDVFNVLLPILNDGKTTDNHGKTVLFNNCIIVMTTNAGAEDAQKVLSGNAGMDFGNATTASQEEIKGKLEKVYERARKRENGGPFKPEMINRVEELGGFMTFLPLTKEVVQNIATRQLEKIAERVQSDDGAGLHGVTLEVTPAVMDQLAAAGYDPTMGARPMRRVIRQKVGDQLGKWLMGHKQEVQSFLDKNGGSATLVIDSVENFDPKITKSKKLEAANDDTPQVKAAAAPKF